MSDILQQLEAVLTQRRQQSADESYVASLYDAGLNKILEKVGEECTEVVLAAKDAYTDASDEDLRQAVISETADLWFHSMVMLSHLELSTEQVLEELQRRFGLSGLEEKASRGT